MSGIRLYLGLTVLAIRARLRLTTLRGALFFGGAVIDPFVYAGIAYFVISGAFGLSGIDRFHFLLIGFISLRWTIGCLLDAGNFRELAARMTEAGRHGQAAGLVLVMAPPTAIMLAALTAAIVLSLATMPPTQKFSELIWLIPVLAVQGLGNMLLVIVVDRLNHAYRIASQYPIAIAAGIAWFISPLMYKFGDLPPTASAVFTSFNPVSHLLAGYYNAYWYGLPMSLEVLPWTGLAVAAVIAALIRRRRGPEPQTPVGTPSPALTKPHLLLLPPGARLPARAGELDDWSAGVVYGQWQRVLNGYSGRDLVKLIAHGRGLEDAAAAQLIEDIRDLSRLDRLFDDSLSIYPEWALAQISLAAAVSGPGAALILDGVLDPTDLVFRTAVWPRLEQEAQSNRPVLIVSRRLLQLPENVTGRFIEWRDGRIAAAGAMGPELAKLYAERLQNAAGAGHTPSR